MTSDRKDKWGPRAALALLLALAGLFFALSTAGGKVVNGIDDNYALRHSDAVALAEGSLSVWDGSYWLGRGYNYPLNIKYIFRAWLPIRWELAANIAFLIALASVFSYLFLRRLRLGTAAAVFGAIAYAWTPHFLTLVYPCHIDSIACGAFAPLLFYALTVAFEARGEVCIRRWTAAVAAGLAWGMLMNEDPQRGIYFSLAALGYTLHLLWTGGELKPLRPNRKLLRAVAQLLLIALLALGVFGGNLARQLGGKNVAGASAADAGAESGWDFATSWSLNPRELVDSLAPNYHGNISGDRDRPYWGSRPVAHSSDALGFFVVLMAALGAALGFRKDGRLRFFTVAALLATLLAFGRFWPGRPLFWLWHQLPMMDKFRAPVKFMAVTAFALAVLSAYGFDGLLRELRSGGAAIKYLKRTLLAALLVGLVWLFGLAGNSPALQAELLAPRLGGDAELARTALGNSLAGVAQMCVYLLLTLAIVALAARWRARRAALPIAAGLLLGLLIFDLLATDLLYLRKSMFDPDEYFAADGVVSTLKAQERPGRVTSTLKFQHQGRMLPLPLSRDGNLYTTYLFPYRRVECFDSPPQARIAGDYQAYFDALLDGLPRTRDPEQIVDALLDDNIRLWQLSNVRYLLSDGYLYGISERPLPIMKLLQARPELKLRTTVRGRGGRPQAIFEIGDSLPRAAFFPSVRTVAERDAALALLKSADFDFHRSALVAADGGTDSGDAPRDFLEPELLERAPGRIRLRIEAPSTGLLLFNSRYDQGWRALVDGEPRAVLPANYISCGVALEPGTQEVEIFYERHSRAQQLSLAAVAAALAALLILPLAGLLRRDRRGAA
jgi:hypothetical protein